MTITWKISSLDHRISDGFVTTAYWSCTGVDGEHSDSAYGTCGWADGHPTVPYADLTEQQVLGWCWANGVDKSAVEATLADRIQAQKTPAVATGTPW
jgi:hypothetical protein